MWCHEAYLLFLLLICLIQSNVLIRNIAVYFMFLLRLLLKIAHSRYLGIDCFIKIFFKSIIIFNFHGFYSQA